MLAYNYCCVDFLPSLLKILKFRTCFRIWGKPPMPFPSHWLLVGNHEVLPFPRVSISFKSTWKRERCSLLPVSTWSHHAPFCNFLPYLLINSILHLHDLPWILPGGTQRPWSPVNRTSCHGANHTVAGVRAGGATAGCFSNSMSQQSGDVPQLPCFCVRTFPFTAWKHLASASPLHSKAGSKCVFGLILPGPWKEGGSELS
jgi:hypothetical protein